MITVRAHLWSVLVICTAIKSTTIKMKIASWNVNSLKVRLEHVLEWTDFVQPDVLALQETKTQDENFPIEEINAAGYQVVFAGQKTYNGVAILSKSPATEVVTDIPGLEDPQRRILAATIDGVRVLCLYVVNGQEVGSDKFDYKLEWIEKVTRFIQQDSAQYEHYVVLGDFNICFTDADVHDPVAWQDKIFCSVEERQAFQQILDLGFTDTYRLFDQQPGSWSWWDYRGGNYQRNIGLRIDLILASKGLAKNCLLSEIDAEPRSWERPSDHAPVVAEFDI